jgi:hypothetical protein
MILGAPINSPTTCQLAIRAAINDPGCTARPAQRDCRYRSSQRVHQLHLHAPVVFLFRFRFPPRFSLQAQPNAFTPLPPIPIPNPRFIHPSIHPHPLARRLLPHPLSVHGGERRIPAVVRYAFFSNHQMLFTSFFGRLIIAVYA